MFRILESIMKKTSILITKILGIFSLILVFTLEQPVYSLDTIVDKIKKTSRFGTVKDKVVKNESEIIIDKINNECCNKKFEKKSELLEIKSFLEQCLSKKCYVGIKAILRSGKPQKLVAIEKIDTAKQLLVENEKFALLEENDDFEKILAEKKDKEEQLKQLKKANEKLKNKIEKMLSSYDERIAELEEQIKTLEEKNKKLFSELPKYKQKKLKEE